MSDVASDGDRAVGRGQLAPAAIELELGRSLHHLPVLIERSGASAREVGAHLKPGVHPEVLALLLKAEGDAVDRVVKPLRDRAVAVIMLRSHTASGTPESSDARFLCEIRLALDYEALIETTFALAAEGRTNRKGMPSSLRLAVIAKTHFDTVRLPFAPAWLQRAALAAGPLLGRLAGYQPTVVATMA